ncbi:MAG: amino acid ABC transporter ATP-binding protein [Polyangiaceae bacterium]
MTEPILAIENLKKKFGDRELLRGISIELQKHSVTALIGPSGCGKSTLLRCINGLETFDAGSVRTGNVTLKAKINSSESLVTMRRKVGFVFQQFNLFAHRTALGNILEAPLYVKHQPRAEAVTRANELLERVGLAHRANAYPRELSGGEQQRVAIARALAMDPEVLLLDEPTSALDPDRRGDVLKVLQELAKAGTTMLLVTHEMSFVREAATEVIVIREGLVKEKGRPSEVLPEGGASSGRDHPGL